MKTQLILQASAMALLLKAQASYAIDQTISEIAKTTIAHEMLRLESEARPISPEQWKLLDSVISTALRAAKAVPEPWDASKAPQVLKEIDKSLASHNFVYPPEEKDWPATLGQALEPKRLSDDWFKRNMEEAENRWRKQYVDTTNPVYLVDCDTGSFIYMAVGELLKIDLRLVRAPKHSFIRWHFNDGSHIPWETTYGESVEESIYQSHPDITERQIKKGIFLKSMTKEEVMGNFYYLRSSLWGKDNPESKLRDLEMAEDLYPQRSMTKNNLAWAYITLPGVSAEKIRDALPIALEGWAADIRDANRLDTVACAFAANKDFAMAKLMSGEAVRRVRDEKTRKVLKRNLARIEDEKVCIDDDTEQR